ncbi:MAG: hypothetical protein PVJ21_14720 [Anaerolineales bacterium]|jgi:hypothetical protein
MPDKNNNVPTLLIGLGATLWLVIALIGYYYTHKPFTVEFVSGAMLSFWRILIVTAIISLSGGIGSRVLSKGVNFSSLTNIVLQATLGAGILGFILLIMGMTIGFHIVYFAIFMLIGGLLFRKHILTWIRQWMEIKSLFRKNALVIMLAIGTGLILLWTMAISLAPPLHFDALTYHLALPQTYLLNGGIAYTPDNMFWGMPQQTEMLYTLAMGLGGAEAATTLGWGFGIITLIGLLGYVKERLNLTAGWVAVACLLGGHSLATSLSWGYTEWPVMLFGLGLFIALDTWRDSSKRSYLLLAAAFAGFALGSKYTAGQLILIGLVIIAWDGFNKRDSRTLINLVLFGGLAALISFPWWVKNWLTTSNPFYPLLFPSGAMTQLRLDHYTGKIWGSWLDMLILPWQAVVWGVEGKQEFSWSIGPLMLGFGALSWVGWQARRSEEKRLLSTAGIATVTGFIIWALASRLNGLLIQTRLFSAFFPAWAILGGIGFDSLTKLRCAGIRFGRIGAAVLLIVFTFNLVEIGREVSQKAPFAVLNGTLSPAAYRTQNLLSYQEAISTLEELPPDARVLMLWETRSLGCLPGCDPDETIDRWYEASLTYSNADEIMATWQSQGYTHLLLNKIGMEFIQENDERISLENWDKLKTLLNMLPSPTSVAPGYELYELDGK